MVRRSFQRLESRLTPLSIVLLSVIVASVAAIGYASAAPRVHEATAELMVLSVGGNALQGETAATPRQVSESLPIIQKLLMTDRVLIAALKNLPPSQLDDLRRVPQGRWLSTLRSRLSVSSLPGTNIVTVRYRSESPAAAQAVLNANLAALLQFMDALHAERIESDRAFLLDERSDVEKQLRMRESHLALLKKEAGFLMDRGRQPLHVLNETVLRLSDACVAAQQETLAARALLHSLQGSIQRGENLQPFLISLGGDVRLSMADPTGATAAEASHLKENLVDAKDALHEMLSREGYGLGHPEVRETFARIEALERQLRQAPAVSAPSNEGNGQQFAQRLLDLATHRFQLASQREQQLRQQLETEKTSAASLNGLLAQLQMGELELARVRKYYDTLGERLQQLRLAPDSGMQFEMVSDPLAPPLPVGPAVWNIALAALLAAGGVGAGLAALRGALARRLATDDEDVPVRFVEEPPAPKMAA